MYRNDKLVIRLNDHEAATVARLAEAERLPASTLARRLLLLEAERVARTETGARQGANDAR